MSTERVRLWDSEGGYVDFDGWARWMVTPRVPGSLDADVFGDEALALPPDESQAQIHPGRCSLYFFASDILLLASDTATQLQAWLDSKVRSGRAVLTAYVRQKATDGAQSLDKVFFFQVQALSYPGELLGQLLGPSGQGMPANSEVLQIDFNCSCWGTAAAYGTQPDYDEETPENCTVLWRALQ